MIDTFLKAVNRLTSKIYCGVLTNFVECSINILGFVLDGLLLCCAVGRETVHVYTDSSVLRLYELHARTYLSNTKHNLYFVCFFMLNTFVCSFSFFLFFFFFRRFRVFRQDIHRAYNGAKSINH